MKRLSRVAFISLLLIPGLSGYISAQSSNSNSLPTYPVKSAIVQYSSHANIGNNTSSQPIFRETFDNYGALLLNEKIDSLTLQLLGEPYQRIFKDGYVFLLNDPQGCVTKYKIKDFEYAKVPDYSAGGFSKKVQDLIHNKINKSNNKNFISFTKTREISFLGHTCSEYEYIVANPQFLSRDRTIMVVYHDICLSEKTYFLEKLVSTIEATSLDENHPIPSSTFEVPQKYRMIDGEKLEVKNNATVSEFNTLIVSYITKKDYYQTKGEGKKILYSKEQGKKSVWEWEETISEYNLSPEYKHFKKIREERAEFLVDYIHKTVNRKGLEMEATNNYNYKTIAELNFLFENKLYDNTVRVLGKDLFLGKECTIFEIKTGIEKLEVYEWQGVFLKIKKYICTDGNICNEYQLYGEETATSVQENVPVSDSLFNYPSDFKYTND